MKRVRVDCAISPICSKQFGEGVTEVVANEGGDNVFVSKGNYEEVVSSCCVKVVLPAQAGVSAGLRVSRGWRLVLLVFHQLLDPRILVGDLAIKYHGELFIVRRVPQGMRHLTDWRYVGERDPR